MTGVIATLPLAAFPQAPGPGAIILGILAVLGGGLMAAVAAFLARRTGNWLYHLGTAAGLLVVAGVAGQRTATDGAPLGPWDAGITVPLIGLHLTPVTAAGLILGILCLTVVLLFEQVQEALAERPQPVHRSLDDDDAI